MIADLKYCVVNDQQLIKWLIKYKIKEYDNKLHYTKWSTDHITRSDQHN